MWSFVMFMILGTYWGLRWLGNKINDVAFEMERKEEQRKRNERIKKEEVNLEEFRSHAASDEEMKKAIHSAIWEKQLSTETMERIRDQAGLTDNVSIDMIARAILAKECKIPLKGTKFGIITTRVGGKEELEIERKFMAWYDKELRTNGLKYPMYFISEKDFQDFRHDPDLAKPVEYHPPIARGSYFWMPIVDDVSISDRFTDVLRQTPKFSPFPEWM